MHKIILGMSLIGKIHPDCKLNLYEIITREEGTYSSVKKFLDEKGNLIPPKISFSCGEEYGSAEVYSLNGSWISNEIYSYAESAEHWIKIFGFQREKLEMLLAELKDNSGENSYEWLEYWNDFEETDFYEKTPDETPINLKKILLN